MFFKYVYNILALESIFSIKPSPCNGVLEYESWIRKVTPVTNMRYGSIYLGTNEELEGIWLRIILDREVEALAVADTATVETSDRRKFLIKNEMFTLKSGEKEELQFYIRYEKKSKEPNVDQISLNGEIICQTQNYKYEEGDTWFHFLDEDHSEYTTTKKTFSDETSRGPVTPAYETKFTKPVIISGSDEFPQNFDPQSSCSVPDDGYDYSPYCGTVGSIPRSALYDDDQSTYPGQFPWHVAIYRYENLDQVYSCGGTLISRQHVLTATHCVYNFNSQRIRDKNEFIVYLGKHQLKEIGCETQERSVSFIHYHPDYIPNSPQADISILRLLHKVTVTDFVKPICLWNHSQSVHNIQQIQGTVIGWGHSIDQKMSNYLMKAYVILESMEKCTQTQYQISNTKALCGTVIQGTSGTFVCNGGSGGGLIFPKEGSSGSNIIWQIRGIGSKQSYGKCDPKQPVIFVDVAEHIAWIKDIIERHGY